MSSPVRWVLPLVAGCAKLAGIDDTAKAPDAEVAAADAALDAPDPCVTDSFDGATLDARWSVLTGATPTYVVADGALVVSDAPFTPTPSNPATSWIYVLDSDKGNQLGWSFAIGGENISVEAELAWSSSDPELTLGGIAVADAQGTIGAMIGIGDGSTGAVGGGVFAKLRVPGGADLAYAGPREAVGTAVVRIERTAGTVRFSVRGAEVLSGALPDLISNVSLYFVRHRNATMMYDFGSVEVRQLTVCR
jgi:hypothetical protein